MPVSTQRKRSLLASIRSWAVLAIMFGMVAMVLAFLDRLQPVRQWMFWRYSMIGGYAMLFGIASFSIGHTAVGLMARGLALPLRERLLFDGAVGVLLFALGVLLAGLCGGLGGVFFWALPLSLILIGIPRIIVDTPNVLAQIRTYRRLEHQRPTLLHTIALGFGLIGLVLVYLPILVPGNMAYDTQVYHLGIAEHYAAAGKIRGFADGWFPGTLPHLASWIYTWAFTIPNSDLHTRVELAAHVEYLLFVFTVAGVPLLVERLLYGRRVRGAWAGFFLFPGIFLYDASLGIAADHVLALWAIPLVLAAMRLTSTWAPGSGLLFAAICGGAALTKSQSIYMLVPIALFVAYRAIVAALRGLQTPRQLAYVLFVPTFGGLLFFTAGHWLANLIWYGNPVYPFWSDFFPSHPWRPGCLGFVRDALWTPSGSQRKQITDTLEAPFTFAFKPHDWATFHRDLPVFGFLFTLSLPILPFFPKSKRIVWLALGSLLGVAIWYWTFHQDRYLQSILPWMVAVAVATLALLWNDGWPVRVGVILLVSLQLIWGGDVPFLPTHAMLGGTPYTHSINLLSSTFRKDWLNRFETTTGYETINSVLPQNSAVLLHQAAVRLGIGRPIFVDNPRWHGAMEYGQLADESKVFQQLKSYGVTHIVAQPERCGASELSLASELVFHHFLLNWVRKSRRAGGWNIWTMPVVAPPSRPFGSVVYIGCGTRGKFTLAEIDRVYAADQAHPAAAGNQLPAVTESLISDVNAVAVDQRCAVAVPSVGGARFEQATIWREVAIRVKRP